MLRPMHIKERPMTRRITVAVASIAALGLASVASADAGHSAATYKASLDAVDPAATTAGLADVVGRARLVDGKRHNKVSLHIRSLAPGTVYLWHVHEGTCASPGAPVAGWTYRTHDAGGNGTLTSNDAGNANTKGTSAAFNADPAKKYSVNVHVATATNGVPAGTIIACGDLNASKASGKSKSDKSQDNRKHGEDGPKKPHRPHAHGRKA
jgi:hypothetical protein